MIIRRVCLLLLALFWAPTLSAQAAARYAVADLGPISNRFREAPAAINNAGQVVAGPYLWRAGKRTSLGAAFVAADISDAGDVVGSTPTDRKDVNGDPIPHGWLWHGSKKTDLGDGFAARAINNRGQIALQGEPGSLWQDGRRTPLRWNTGSIQPVDINDGGQVLGTGGVWDKGRLTELQNVFPPGGPDNPADSWIETSALSSTGMACGWCGVSGPGSAESPAPRAACLWVGGKARQLGNLPGLEDAIALGINSQGIIVGACGAVYANEAVDDRAFVWQKGVLTDLNRLAPRRPGRVFLAAKAINNRGQIVCLGRQGSQRHLYVLTPTKAAR